MASPDNSSLFPASNRLTRRTILQALAWGAVVPCVGVAQDKLPVSRPSAAAASRKGMLVRPDSLDLLNMRCKIVLELEGQLQIDEPDPKKSEETRTAEVKSKSTLEYFENIAFDGPNAVAAARQYTTAESESWLSGSSSTAKLRPGCQETRMTEHAGTWQQFCPQRPLDAREVDLLQSPVNSSALEVLLPPEPAKVDTAWTISKAAAKDLFNLEAVHQSGLSAKVVKVEKGVATVEIAGELDATANSVPTKLRVRGNFHARLGSQCAIVSWLGLVIQEERGISQVEPGFNITARIRLIRAEVESPLEANAQQLRALAAQDEAGVWLVQLQSIPGRYRMLADRRWKTYIDSGEEAILRMIENNTVIAQCNIAKLPQLDAGTQLTLEALQADIQKSLGDAFGSIDEASEKVTPSGLRLLRIVASGELEEVPIQWIYTHLSDDSGRRVAMEFTMGGNYVERFAGADEQMTSSFELLATPEQTTAVPTPAPRVSNQPTPAAKR